MFKGLYVFSQITDHLPLHTFRRCVERYHGERYVKQFRCFDQYLTMSFAQLTHRESLRDIESLPSGSKQQTLSYGSSVFYFTKYNSRRKRATRLVNL